MSKATLSLTNKALSAVMTLAAIALVPVLVLAFLSGSSTMALTLIVVALVGWVAYGVQNFLRDKFQEML